MGVTCRGVPRIVVAAALVALFGACGHSSSTSSGPSSADVAAFCCRLSSEVQHPRRASRRSWPTAARTRLPARRELDDLLLTESRRRRRRRACVSEAERAKDGRSPMPQRTRVNRPPCPMKVVRTGHAAIQPLAAWRGHRVNRIERWSWGWSARPAPGLWRCPPRRRADRPRRYAGGHAGRTGRPSREPPGDRRPARRRRSSRPASKSACAAPNLPRSARLFSASRRFWPTTPEPSGQSNSSCMRRFTTLKTRSASSISRPCAMFCSVTSSNRDFSASAASLAQCLAGAHEAVLVAHHERRHRQQDHADKAGHHEVGAALAV